MASMRSLLCLSLWNVITISIIYSSRIQACDALVIAYDQFNGSEQFQDMQASFGPGVSSDGMLGVLVHAVPYNACIAIQPPPFAPAEAGIENITMTSFALISRGDCDFGLKVLNAQKAGYVGAIVHNVKSDVLLRMSTSITNEIVIPAVFIGQTSGSILNTSYLYNEGGRPYIQLYEGSFNPLEYYLIPFIIVISVCFVSLLCFMLIKCLRDRRRARRGRLSLQRLKKLPVKKYDKGDEYDVCAICLDDYEEGDSLRILPCAHAYHCKCVDPWLTSSKRVCPLCKRRVLSDDESNSSSSDDDDSSDDERTPLVQSSTASSPNAARFATGFGTRNPLMRDRGRIGEVGSYGSADTTSTEVSEDETTPLRHQQSRRKEQIVTVVREDLAHSSGYQPQVLTPVSQALITMGVANPMMDPNDYLTSAEAYIVGKSRASESSIAVLSDDETMGTSPRSVSSQDYHSLEENSLVLPNDEDTMGSGNASDITQDSDTDHDDIIVIANGSEHIIHEDDTQA